MKQQEEIPREKELNDEKAERDLSNLAALSIAELEEELKKKRELDAKLSYYTDKGEFTDADCKFIRDNFGIEPTYSIVLDYSKLPEGVSKEDLRAAVKSLEYRDQISDERLEAERLIIMKHFPHAQILNLKDVEGRDVNVIVGVDPTLANGVFEMEKKKIKTDKDIIALKNELAARGVIVDKPTIQPAPLPAHETAVAPQPPSTAPDFHPTPIPPVTVQPVPATPQPQETVPVIQPTSASSAPAQPVQDAPPPPRFTSKAPGTKWVDANPKRDLANQKMQIKSESHVENLNLQSPSGTLSRT